MAVRACEPEGTSQTVTVFVLSPRPRVLLSEVKATDITQFAHWSCLSGIPVLAFQIRHTLVSSPAAISRPLGDQARPRMKPPPALSAICCRPVDVVNSIVCIL